MIRILTAAGGIYDLKRERKVVKSGIVVVVVTFKLHADNFYILPSPSSP